MAKRYLNQEEFYNLVDGLAERLDYNENHDEMRFGLDSFEDIELRTIYENIYKHSEFELYVIAGEAIVIRRKVIKFEVGEYYKCFDYVIQILDRTETTVKWGHVDRFGNTITSEPHTTEIIIEQSYKGASSETFVFTIGRTTVQIWANNSITKEKIDEMVEAKENEFIEWIKIAE